MSYDQAVEALGKAGREEFGDEQAQPATPEGATQQPEQEGQPEAQVAPEPTEPATFDGGRFNPDELPPELQEGWKQLQAAFTQKTQELAEQRNEINALGDPESLQQAVDLYNRIGDPQNWGQLHAELTQAMVQAGYTFPEAAQAAAEVVTQAAEPAAPSQYEDMDPDVASLAKQLEETRSELQQFRTGYQEELRNAEAERLYIQEITELQRSEAAIREAHPQWGDDQIAQVYRMSSFYNGNLAQAAAELESIRAHERELYLNQKSGAMQDSTRTPATNFAQDAAKVVEPQTLLEAEAAATEEFLARLAAEEA